VPVGAWSNSAAAAASVSAAGVRGLGCIDWVGIIVVSEAGVKLLFCLYLRAWLGEFVGREVWWSSKFAGLKGEEFTDNEASTVSVDLLKGVVGRWGSLIPMKFNEVGSQFLV
jgi:hypothetical protein